MTEILDVFAESGDKIVAALVETGYLTDPGNLRLLMSPAGRERLAGAIAAGIADFYAGQAQR